LRSPASELAALSVEHFQQRLGRWVIADLIGKGRRVRSVPMPSWAKAAADRWTNSAGIAEGRILRAINKADRLASDHVLSATLRNAAGCDRNGVLSAGLTLRKSLSQL
jgi:integrase